MPPSRRDELIEAAMRVFARHGFHGTNLDMVLEEGGLCRMTLYNHFKSKDDLIVAALERRDSMAREKLAEFLDGAGPDPVQKMLSVFDFQREWFGSDAFCGCIFMKASGEFCDPESPARQTVARHMAAVLDMLTGLSVEAGFEDPDSMAQQILLLMEGAVVVAQALGQRTDSVMRPVDAAAQAQRAAEQLLAAASTVR